MIGRPALPVPTDDPAREYRKGHLGDIGGLHGEQEAYFGGHKGLASHCT